MRFEAELEDHLNSSRSGKDAAGGYRVGALRRTVRIRRQDALVFRDRQGRMSVEGIVRRQNLARLSGVIATKAKASRVSSE